MLYIVVLNFILLLGLLNKFNVIHSLSEKGYPYDNASVKLGQPMTLHSFFWGLGIAFHLLMWYNLYK